jgi:geranylgeranyl diphosphate synthase type II
VEAMMDNTAKFTNYLSKTSQIVNVSLKENLPKNNSLISQMMSYAVLNGGKRLRPCLVIIASALFGMPAKKVLPAACAVEFLHSYSLVHDDLPAMDNDDLRRGKPTVHKKFGYAAAILCGDALLTESFNLLLKSKAEPKNINAAVQILSQYGGYQGMIDGQIEDTLETGKWNKKSRAHLLKKLKFIQEKKTADLIIASLKIGAVLAGADKKSLAALEKYGLNIGCAFQITDDILDALGDKKLLGKRGSDKDNDKLTAFSLLGADGAQKEAQLHIKKAHAALEVFGKKADILRGLADFIIERKF